MAARTARAGRLRRARVAAVALAASLVASPAAADPSRLCLPASLAESPWLPPGAPFDAWSWHRLEYQPAGAAALAQPVSVGLGPLVPAALQVLRSSGHVSPLIRVSPRARTARVLREATLTGTLAQQLDSLGLLAAHDVRVHYDPDVGLLSVQQPPLAELRVAAVDGPLFAAGVVAGVGVEGLHFDGYEGRLVFGVEDQLLPVAARALLAARLTTGRAILDLRLLTLPPGAAALWASLASAAPRVHYAPEGAAALSWPYEDLPAASLARDRLLAAATDHTGRRVPLLPGFLTVLPFDPRRACVSRSSAPMLPTLSPDLGIAWAGDGRRLDLGVLPRASASDAERWARARPLAVPMDAGAVLAFRSGHSVLWAQLRLVPLPEDAS